MRKGGLDKFRIISTVQPKRRRPAEIFAHRVRLFARGYLGRSLPGECFGKRGVFVARRANNTRIDATCVVSGGYGNDRVSNLTIRTRRTESTSVVPLPSATRQGESHGMITRRKFRTRSRINVKSARKRVARKVRFPFVIRETAYRHESRMKYSHELSRISRARRAAEGHAANKIKIFIAVSFCYFCRPRRYLRVLKTATSERDEPLRSLCPLNRRPYECIATLPRRGRGPSFAKMFVEKCFFICFCIRECFATHVVSTQCPRSCPRSLVCRFESANKFARRVAQRRGICRRLVES